MRLRLLLIATTAASALALPGSAATASAAGPGCTGRDDVPNVQNLATIGTTAICLVNEERTSRGLKSLRSVMPLQAVATAYAERMVSERFFEHTSPDGGTFLSRIKRTNYLSGTIRRWTVGENIAWGTGSLATPAAIVKAWMASPRHRRNILARGFTELGMGVALGAPDAAAGGYGATYVNEFGLRHR